MTKIINKTLIIPALLLCLFSCKEEQQPQSVVELSIDETLKTVVASEQTVRFYVKSNNSWKVSKVNESDWITYFTDEGSGEGNILLRFEQNATLDSRSARFKLVSKVDENIYEYFSLSQKGKVKDVELSLNETIKQTSEMATSVTFKVTSNDRWKVNKTNSCDWVNYFTDSGENNGIIQVCVDQNTYSFARQANFRVVSESDPTKYVDFKVSQSGTDPGPDPEHKGWQNTGKYEMSNGIISHECLMNYLSRAITEAEYLHSRKYNCDGYYGTEDDTRMLKNVGAKFIGRAMYHWGKDSCLNTDAKWSAIKEKIKAYHDYDPTAIFQAAIFEIVSSDISNVPVPDWVFTAFGKQVEQRNFRYDDIYHSSRKDYWGKGASVPDISKEEAQMYFYFQAVKYMELGIEAIHLGQVEMMAGFSDYANNYAGLKRTTNLIHQAAKTKARRGTVLLDGHLSSGGIFVDGVSLFDFCSFPMRPCENLTEPASNYPANLKQGYLDCIIGKTKGGKTPSGWTATRLPYILEFDNFGTSSHPGKAEQKDIFVWGWDEISWFANTPIDYSKKYLVQSVDYLNTVDPDYGFLQMPGLRCAVGRMDEYKVYRCNYMTSTTPEGKGTEPTIKNLWK